MTAQPTPQSNTPQRGPKSERQLLYGLRDEVAALREMVVELLRRTPPRARQLSLYDAEAKPEPDLNETHEAFVVEVEPTPEPTPEPTRPPQPSVDAFPYYKRTGEAVKRALGEYRQSYEELVNFISYHPAWKGSDGKRFRPVSRISLRRALEGTMSYYPDDGWRPLVRESKCAIITRLLEQEFPARGSK